MVGHWCCGYVKSAPASNRNPPPPFCAVSSPRLPCGWRRWRENGTGERSAANIKLELESLFMKSFIGLVLVIGVSSPALADIEDRCADLWFSRNAMLDKVGYCFSTPLGKAIFNNNNCTTKQPKVSSEVSEQIAAIRMLEQGDADGVYQSCHIDTSQRELDLPVLELRKQLDFQPVTDGGVAMCIGYRDGEQTLYSAPRKTATKTGAIRQGDSVMMGHLDWNGWSFGTVWRDDRPDAVGWYHAPIADVNQCEGFAG